MPVVSFNSESSFALICHSEPFFTKSTVTFRAATMENVSEFLYLDLERLLQLFDDRLSVLQLHAQTFCIGDFCPESRRPHVDRRRILGETTTQRMKT